MTKLKKLMSAGVLSAAAIGIAFAGTTMAANQTTRGVDNGRPQITAEQAAQHETEMTAKFTKAFADAEAAGKITATQEAKLLELDTAVRTAMKSGDHTAADAARTAMHDWMTSNNIDSSVMPTPPKDGHGPGHKGPRSNDVESTSSK